MFSFVKPGITYKFKLAYVLNFFAIKKIDLFKTGLKIN